MTLFMGYFLKDTSHHLPVASTMRKWLEILIVLIVFYLKTPALEKKRIFLSIGNRFHCMVCMVKASRAYEENWKKSFQLRILNVI